MHAGQLPEHTCPRRGDFAPVQEQDFGKDTPREDGTCSYCGSYPADKLLELLEKGELQIVPTDKNYKVYLNRSVPAEQEAALKEEARLAASKDEDGEHRFEEWWELARHDIIRGERVGKFYFQHFDEVQMQKFVDLYNENKLRFGYPGYFYVLPFFMKTKVD